MKVTEPQEPVPWQPSSDSQASHDTPLETSPGSLPELAHLALLEPPTKRYAEGGSGGIQI